MTSRDARAALAMRLERLQVPLYAVAIGVGAIVGLLVPASAAGFEVAVGPLLALLLFVTFLGIPFDHLLRALRDVRFLIVVLLVNFAIVPVIVWLLSRFVAHDEALLLGVLLVLLTPCIDYVIVFAGLAGGARLKLLAVTPLLMILQVMLLPAYVWIIAGAEVVQSIDPAPFVQALLFIVALPLAAAIAVQVISRRLPGARSVEVAAAQLMVPLMMLTLGAVVASQVYAVSSMLTRLLIVVPIFVLFAICAGVASAVVGRWARLDVPSRRATVFSAVTRNSLVVLPLALAMPSPLTPLVVVTQTLVELAVMVAMIGIVPRCIRSTPKSGARDD